MRRSTIAAALLIAAAAAAGAQAPKITPSGDPSVRDDSIYKLVVNPKDYADQRYVYLLDDGVVRFEADGSGTRTYRQVLQILTPEGAEAWGEQSFGYSTNREKLTINWVRVLDSTGKVISSKPVHEQESLAPVAMEAPVYSDEMIHRVSLGGVAPGTIVDYSYTVETLKPLIPGDYFTSWSMLTGLQTQRSRFILDLPERVDPRIIERHLTFKRTESVSKGRRTYVWATQNLKKTEREPFAPDSMYGEGITVGSRLTWNDVSKWYAGLAKGRYALDPAIEKRALEVIAGAKTRDDTLRMLYRWVAQDFRYVSLSLGIGGYQPHPPSTVYENKYGDCKDKATFFIAVARRFGYQAYPVLLSASGGVDTLLPTAHQFDHMIAAVAKPGGGWQFLDLTAEIVPYGDMPPDEQGEFGLLVNDDGAGTSVIFPELPPSANRSSVLIAGELTVDGGFTGKWTVTASGNNQYGMRQQMSGTTKPDSAARARMTLSVANSIVEGSTGDSLQLFEGRDLNAVPRFSVVIRGGNMINDEGGIILLELPIDNFAQKKTLSSLEARGPRKAPVSSDKVWGPDETVQELRLTLPVGWKAKLPANVQVKTIYGEYEAAYSQVGRELRVKRRRSGTSGVFPASDYAVLLGFLRDIAKDDHKVIVLDK
jgi:transglutaminase-like putative cysteine protease